MNANQKAIRISTYTTKHRDSSSKNSNKSKSPSTLSPNNVFHSNDSRSHSSRTASVMKVQRSKNSYFSNWFDYHDSSFSGFFGQSLLTWKIQVDINVIFFLSTICDLFCATYEIESFSVNFIFAKFIKSSFQYTLIEYFLFKLKILPCLEIIIVLESINWTLVKEVSSLKASFSCPVSV